MKETFCFHTGNTKGEKPLLHKKDGVFDIDMLSQPLNPERKNVHVVDGGLTMNIPVPAVLRPERKVDILLTFDFSQRTDDWANPFEVFLLINNFRIIISNHFNLTL